MRTRLSSFGPALFILGATIGTGSVSSLVIAGADHGTALLWALALSCVFFWVLVSAMSRLTFASGETFVTAVRRHIGKPAAFYIVIAIVVGQFSSNIGVLGIVSEAVASWLNVSFLGSALFWCSLVYAMMYFGSYARFELMLTLLVALLALSFFAELFFVGASPAAIVAGLAPSIPPGGAVVVAVMRSFVVADKGWGLAELRHERRDALVSAALVFVVSGIVMTCAAATLHVQGIRVEKAIDMAFTLEPLAGRFAATLFVVGIVAAGISSAFPNALVSIWTISDYFQLSRSPQALHFRLIALAYCAAGLIAPLAGGRPVFIQIASLAVQALFMPVLVILMLILLNRKDVVGEHTNSTAMNVMCGIALVFTSFMAYQAVVGLFEMIGN
jgi:manganese transport protein